MQRKEKAMELHLFWSSHHWQAYYRVSVFSIISVTIDPGMLHYCDCFFSSHSINHYFIYLTGEFHVDFVKLKVNSLGCTLLEDVFKHQIN